MKTWNDYKEHVRTVDSKIGKDIDEVENISSIVSAMIEQHRDYEEKSVNNNLL